MSEPNETVNAAQQAPENDASVERANAALDALQQGLDAAVDAEPEFAEKFGDKTEDNAVVWTNVGKTENNTSNKTPHVSILNQYRAISGGQIVYAQRIKAFVYDKYGARASVVLMDDTEKVRPRTHGFIPKLGDYYVAYTPITKLATGVGYVEEADTAIIGKRLFESLYIPVVGE